MRPLSRLRPEGWWDFSLRGPAGLDVRANRNERTILRGRTSLCPPLELARALQEEEGENEGEWEDGKEEGRRKKEEGRYHIVKASLARAWLLSVETQFRNKLRRSRTRERHS